jgi:DNA helicase-2/ATP-dependent DNA helicase PcrA
LTNRIHYEEVLNPTQLQAVMTREGPLLVIAGAGSGKTRTLVYRVARLVETGAAPESILLLTFTRKAAGEMLERAASLADERCRFVSGGTFHSLAHRVLRSAAHHLGFENSFTVLDRSDMEEVIQSLVQDMHIDRGAIRFPKRSTLTNIVSKAANLERSVDALMEEEYGQFLEYVPQVRRLRELYAEYKKENQLMDYDDLILFFRKLLSHHEDIRALLSEQYRYIMVDEYQDTNTIQADIVKWLSQARRNIMVVGDDAQSIYSFRGANYKNMFEFPKLFPEAKLIKLEQNYRSTQPILNLTNALMGQAREKYTKCLFTDRKNGEIPKVVDARTEPEQALFVCRAIKEELSKGGSLKDFAVLFRAAYHSFELEVELARQGIPFVKYGGFKFMESAHIKDVLAYLRVIVNREDGVSWGRILRMIKNIGPGKSQAIISWMKETRSAPSQVTEWPGTGKGDDGLKSLAALLADLSVKDLSPQMAVERVMQYYKPILQEKFDDFPRREKDLEQLIPMASRYGKLRPFLDDLLLEPPNSAADLGTEKRAECLTLSTVHSAKGLEWPVVFVIWVMEGYFPPARASMSGEALEEERRLMYVAATRAKDRLILCYPGQDTGRSWISSEGRGVSSFIHTLPRDVMESCAANTWERQRGTQQRAHQRALAGKGPLRGFPPISDHPSGLRAGDRVRHPAFGQGVVSKLVGAEKVEVLFRDVGRKLLHLGYTSLEKV